MRLHTHARMISLEGTHGRNTQRCPPSLSGPAGQVQPLMPTWLCTHAAAEASSYVWSLVVQRRLQALRPASSVHTKNANDSGSRMQTCAMCEIRPHALQPSRVKHHRMLILSCVITQTEQANLLHLGSAVVKPHARRSATAAEMLRP